ncbi:MAG TPA: hypothetical protein VEL07_19800 [Planctomycetota bacterium]|nr:hypothetical protein [Planctomycetota bacterium]
MSPIVAYGMHLAVIMALVIAVLVIGHRGTVDPVLMALGGIAAATIAWYALVAPQY